MAEKLLLQVKEVRLEVALRAAATRVKIGKLAGCNTKEVVTRVKVVDTYSWCLAVIPS